MMSYHIPYQIATDLAGLSPEAMARKIEGIASCLWSPAEELTLPLNAAKGSKLTGASAGWDQMVQ